MKQESDLRDAEFAFSETLRILVYRAPQGALEVASFMDTYGEKLEDLALRSRCAEVAAHIRHLGVRALIQDATHPYRQQRPPAASADD